MSIFSAGRRTKPNSRIREKSDRSQQNPRINLTHILLRDYLHAILDTLLTGFTPLLKVKSLKKKLEEVTKDNGDLLCAVKYLKSKMEQKDAPTRCATPTVDAARSTSFGREVHPLSLGSVDHDTRALRDRCSALERENARLRQRATSEGSSLYLYTEPEGGA